MFLVNKKWINGLPHKLYKPIWQITILVLEENFQISPKVWLQISPIFKLGLILITLSSIEAAWWILQSITVDCSQLQSVTEDYRGNYSNYRKFSLQRVEWIELFSFPQWRCFKFHYSLKLYFFPSEYILIIFFQKNCFQVWSLYSPMEFSNQW